MLDSIELILELFAPIVAEKIAKKALDGTYNDLKERIKKKFEERPEAELVDNYEKLKDQEEQFKKALTEVLADRDMEIIRRVQNLMAQVFPEKAQEGEYNVRITRDFQNPVVLVFQNGIQQTVPFLAPPRPHYSLTGRENLLNTLKQQLSDNGSATQSGYLALYGMPGVGKTALAIELANDPDILEHFPDGVLWTGLGREADVLSHLGEWGAALGISAEMKNLTSVKKAARAIHNAIGRRQMLLIIDDVWEIETVTNFRLGGPYCARLVTTRLPQVAKHFAGEYATPVPELGEPDGMELLKSLAPSVVKTAREEVRDLVKLVGGLPLAIILIGTYLQKEASHDQKRRLQKALDKLHKTEEIFKIENPSGPFEEYVSLSLETVIGISDEALDEVSQRTLRALSVFPPKPNTFSESAALAVSAEPSETLDTLVDYGLLETSEDSRYTMHQTIADYAKKNLSNKDPYRRMAEFFVSYTETHKTDYEALDLETSNILAAFQIAVDQKMKKALVRGTNAFYDFVEARGLYETDESYLNQARQAAKSLKNNAELARILLNLGRLTEKRKNRTQAEKYYKEGLDLAREIKDRGLISDLLRNLGVTLSKGNNLDQAEKYYKEGLDLAREIENYRLISDHLQGLGIVESKRYNLDQAEAHLSESLDLAREKGYHSRVAALLASMVILENKRKDYEKAGEYFEEGYDLAKKIGDRRRISSLLVTMGFLELSREDYKQAERYALEGLKIVLEMGYYERVDTFLRILDSAHERGGFEEEEKYSLEGVEPSQMKRDYEEISVLIETLGILERDRENFLQAEKYLQKGLELARKINNSERISSLLQNLGILERDRENFLQADEYLQKGLELAQKIDHTWLMCCILNECGECHLKQEKLNEASEAFDKSLEIARKMGLREPTAVALYGLARISADQKNFVEAKRHGLESLSLFENMGHKRIDEVSQWLAGLP